MTTLENMVGELCNVIEKIGASPEQTLASVKACDVYHAIQQFERELAEANAKIKDLQTALHLTVEAHKEELASKDAEIERLRGKIETACSALSETIDVIQHRGGSHPMDIARWTEASSK